MHVQYVEKDRVKANELTASAKMILLRWVTEHNVLERQIFGIYKRTKDTSGSKVRGIQACTSITV
mgnify:CR=1 FL=1